MKKCIKCGYVRTSNDVAPEYECPKCGVIYEKAEAALIKQNVKIEIEKNKGNKLTVQPESKIQKDNDDFVSLFKSAPMWQRLFISFIFIFGAYAAIIGNDKSSKEKNYNPTANPKYTQTRNSNGVKFYYFKSKQTPELEPINNFSDLNNSQLNKILSSIPSLPKLPSSSYRKGGKYIFVKDLDKGSKISIHIQRCNKGQTSEYFCIEKLIHSPDPREMAKARASNKNSQNEYFVSKEQYGEKWPFTFGFGLLKCKRYRDIVILYNHTLYAVNGKALSAKYSSDYKRGENLYEDPWSVRKNRHGGGKVPFPSGFIQKGLNLCNKQ